MPRKKSSQGGYYSNKPVDVVYQAVQQAKFGSGPVFPTYTFTRPSPPKFNSRIGRSVSDYVMLIQRRLDATTDYTNEHWDETHVPGHLQFDYVYLPTGLVVTSSYSGSLLRYHTWPSLYTGSLNDINDSAITKFLSAAYKAQTSFQGGVFLGELKEAVNMIRHPLDSIVSGMQSFLKSLRRRKGRKSLLEIQKMIAGTWLEYVFGWGPLLNDIDSGAKALANAITYKAPTAHVIGTAKKSGNAFGSFYTLSPDNQYLYLTYQAVTAYEVSITYEGGIFATPGGGSGGLSDFGFGIKDFAPTIWELIPYSFLVDYIVNVGQFVEALSFCRSDIIYCSKTVRSSCKMTPGNFSRYNGIEPPNPAYKILAENLNYGSAVLEGRSFARGVVDKSSLLPSLAFKLENLNFRKGANVSALGAYAAATSKILRN